MMVADSDPPKEGQGNGEAIILFTKVPRPGLVKTRLIGHSGPPFPPEVAALYTSLLEDTLVALAEVNRARGTSLLVSFTPSDGEAELSGLVRSHFNDVRFIPQVGKSVTERVRNAFETVLQSGYERVALIPGDHADLSGPLLEEAFARLEGPGPAVVLGPTYDGGAFLLGFNAASFELVRFDLENTHLVCADIFRRSKAQGIPTHFLDNRNDIDDWEDARHFLMQERMAHTKTWQALKQMEIPSGAPGTKALVSVIIPTLNEEAAIDGVLDSLAGQTSRDFDVTVADGVSSDRTVDKAWGRADSIAFIRRASRKGQENAAAADARGDALLFLHADTVVPPTLVSSVIEALRSPDVSGGSFRVVFRGNGTRIRFLNALKLCGSRVLGIHGISSGFFIRRSVFERAGGFRESVMEEAVDLQRRVSSGTRFVFLDDLCTTSARRFDRKGRFTSTLIVWLATVILTYAGLHFTFIERTLWKSVR